MILASPSKPLGIGPYTVLKLRRVVDSIHVRKVLAYPPWGGLNESRHDPLDDKESNKDLAADEWHKKYQREISEKLKYGKCLFYNGPSNASMIFAVCSACVPDPTFRCRSGLGIERSRKKTSDMFSS